MAQLPILIQVMRINDEFATERKSEITFYKPKYFIASEGSNSEPMYFEGLNKSVIFENVTIINILRDYATMCNSHPSFIIKMIKESILDLNAGEITVIELKNKIDNCIRQNSYKINIEAIYNKLIEEYKKDDYRIKKDKLGDLFLKLFKEEIYKDLAENFPLYFEAQDVTYSNTRDKLNIVIDRDEQNFKENQYENVIKFCENNNINLYVSNPTFEFWLMFHFSEIENEDETMMHENRYVNKSRRYLEKRLSDICNYKKSQLDFSKFEPYIYDAIEREKNYCEDINGLKTQLGSNVGHLINDMLTNNN